MKGKVMSDHKEAETVSDDGGGVEETEKVDNTEVANEAEKDGSDSSDNSGEGVDGASKDTDWKSEARKWEQRAKANLADLEALRNESSGFEDTISGLRAENDDLKAKVAGFESDNLRRDIMDEYGLPGKAAAFLSGDSREEIAASAESLRDLIGHSSPGMGRLAGNPPADNTQYREGADFVDALINSRR